MQRPGDSKPPKPLTVEEMLADITGCAPDDIVFQADQNQGSFLGDEQVTNMKLEDKTAEELYNYVDKLFKQHRDLEANMRTVEQDNEKVTELKTFLKTSLEKLQSDCQVLNPDS